MASAPKSLVKIASLVAWDTAVIKSIARYATKMVSRAVKEAVKYSILTSPPSLPSGSDSSSDKVRKSRKDTRPKKKLSRCKLFVFPSDKRLRSLNRLMKKAAEWSEPSTSSSNVEDRGPKLKVLQAAHSHFQIVINYKTYHLLDKSQTFL